MNSKYFYFYCLCFIAVSVFDHSSFEGKTVKLQGDLRQ